MQNISNEHIRMTAVPSRSAQSRAPAPMHCPTSVVPAVASPNVGR